ncbi:quinone oxidoreductase family protein [[Enterobacter] lignolyticus]|uniref:Alcohol dehydrogenase n=1 Tax=[Enterobacter] lignolyticus TaxID=1334193 RepID=A0A806XA80_9ENTR|nr:zinc-binding alcohol dehydrogenase family protein [[Enterobacter] lignolyticus]ALR76543.1 alcohol dehydrogenase [[Enterobacter] lignolyticus]
MKAAVVYSLEQGPVYADFAMPQAQSGQQIVQVSAAAISHVVKSRASGQHYSYDGTLPFIAGVDGTGVTRDGQRVWFAFPPSPWGSMAEFVPVAIDSCVALPDDLDDVTAAAMANPGMSAWAALVDRAGFRPGETVLINGATGSAGQLAVQIARHLGAKKIVATGRNMTVLNGLGADVAIALTADAAALEQQLAEQAAGRIDVVVDYLWGNVAQTLLTSLATHASGTEPIRYVQVGAQAGQDITLAGALLRASPIQLMGSGIGSLSFPRLVAATGAMLQAAAEGGFRIAHTTAPLSDVARAWPLDDSKHRTVFTVADNSL